MTMDHPGADESLVNTNTGVFHYPISNMVLVSDNAFIREMTDANIREGLVLEAIDGSNHLFGEARQRPGSRLLMVGLTSKTVKYLG